MRYEDASQAGSFNDATPMARDDADHLAAADYGPATGNIITGAGTITGATGTDTGGSQITAIQGAGGTDTSFEGGVLEIAGQYGVLTIDAQGNYSYVRNPGTPEGVTDTFTYTLANAAGATDTAQLVINIGDTPMLAFQGTQTVRTADGVIVLPAGVDLSDVRVVGRDLVITLPDGSTMRIPDGAVFVPRLVIDGVEVPASNLAALLIDSEPRPAAGDAPPPSSGGNFANPVAPLDPGVPLGDLLPPTELTYTPPEIEEVGDFLEDNDPPFVGVSTVNVSEEGLANGLPDNVGTPDTTNSPIANGVLPVSDPDGDPLDITLGVPSGSFTSGGVAITWAVSADGNTLTGSAGGNTVITVSINNNGAYTVTLSRPIDHPTGGGEQGSSIVVPVSVTDGEDVGSGGSITIVVEDDSPQVTALTVEEPVLTVADRDFATNDTGSFSANFAAAFGADGAAAANPISYSLGINAGATGLVDTLSGQAVVLSLEAGQVVGRAGAGGPIVFVVTVSAAGTVTLDQQRAVVHNDPADPVEAGASAATLAADNLVTLTATATDRDGDTASATLNIGLNLRFEDDGPSIDPVLNANATVTLDETGPAGAAAINTGAIVKGDDPDVAGSGAIASGNSGVAIVNANAVFGNDGPAAGGGIAYALTVTNPASGVTLTDGSTITLTNVGGVIVGVVDNGPFAGQAAFAIAINAATGVVTVEQYLTLDHPVNPDPNDPLSLGENTIAVSVTATDGDGDSAGSGAIDISGQITFLDDGPSVSPVLNANATVLLDETGPAGAATINTGAIVKGDDPDVAGTGAIASGNSGSAVVNANAAFGADGPAVSGSISYALTLGISDTPLTLTDGSTITLTLVGGVIVGVVDNGPFAGQAAFAIAINTSTGVVTVEQYLSLDHPVNPNPNDPLGLGPNTVSVTVTATDGDGDPVTSGGIDISGQITFLDDGPSVDPEVIAESTILLDESGPSSPATIDTGTIVKGDDPNVAGGGAISSANSGASVVDANAAFGADGPAASNSLTYALVLGSLDTPLTLTDGSAITLQLVNGVIVGVVDSGPFAGQAAFAIAINSVTGVVTIEQYLSLDHPVNPDPNDPVGIGPNTIGVTVTATDGDGDPVTSDPVDISGQITFLDDGPAIDPVLNQQGGVTVDESPPVATATIDTLAIVKGDDPDLEGGLAIGRGQSSAAPISANVFFGADGPLGDGLSYALSVLNPNSGLTLTDGSTISLQLLANGVVVGVVDNGVFAGQAAFAIQIDPVSGQLTVEQYLSLDHPISPNNFDEPVFLANGALGATVTATDGDGDSVTSPALDIGSLIRFEDDGPSISPVLNANATVLLDETGPAGAATINTGAIVKGDDPDVAGTGAIASGNSGTAVVTPNAVFGADGPALAGSISYALALGISDTPLTLTDGSTITLTLVGGVIVGVVDNGPFAGQAAFAIAINTSTGVVTVEQYLSLDHPVNPNPNDPLGLGPNTVSVTVTATDGDGDQITSGSIDISGQVTFLDDGPSVSPVLNANATVLLDETGPAGAATINTGAIVKGDDPDVAGTGAIASGNSGSAVVNANAAFGADGPAAGGGLTYALTLGVSDTPLTLTDGSTITLTLVGDVIVGVVDNGPFAGQAAFAIAINAATGVVTVEQYLSLDHPVNPNPNDPLGLGPNTVSVTVTATDGDGDPVTSGGIDISGQITFLDDGPSVSAALSTQGPVEVDESAPVAVAVIDTLTVDKGDDPHLGGGLAIGSGSTVGAVITPNAAFGADGPAVSGSLVYDLVVTNAASGLTTTEGDAINLVELANGVIVGVVQTGAFAGDAAFAISINSATGVVTVEQYLSLKHPDFPDNFDEGIFLAAGSLSATVTATDGDGDSVTSNAVDITSKFRFDDDGPTAIDEAQQNVVEGGTVNGVFDFNAGADGGGVTHINGIALVFGMDGFSQSIDIGPGSVKVKADGTYSFTAENPAPNGPVNGTFTVTDGDGDEVEADFSFNILDGNFPTAGTSQARLDDDGLAGGNPASTAGDIDANVGEVAPVNPSEAIFHGQLNFSFGGDGPGSINFAVMHGTTGTVGTETVTYSWNAGTLTLTAVITGGARNGTTLFTLQLDDATSGQYTLTLNDNVLHAPGGNDETSAPVVPLNFTVLDSDGSVSVPNGTLNITFNDDAPTLNVTKGADAGVILTTDDADTIGAATDTATSAAAFGGVFGLTFAAGADGAAVTPTLNYTLGVSLQGVDSGLNQGGNNIFLYLIGGKVVGSTSAVQGNVNAGNTVFDVGVSGTGVVTLTQYSQIDHVGGDPSPTGEPFNDHIVSMADELITLTASASITDADGDTASDSETVNIGANLRFTDDGPDAQVNLQAALDTIILDETRPEGTDTAGGSAPNGDMSATANFADNFVGVIDYGADGPGSVSYSLVLSANGIGSGLFALDPTDTSIADGDGYGQGAQITLSQVGNTITGSVGMTNYFTITIDPATGIVTFTQLNPIWHPNTGSFDETATLTTAAAANIRVVQTVTDFDGDTDSASINVGQGVFAIQDDGPNAIQPDAAVLTNEAGDSVTADLDDDGEVITDFGEDGPGLVRFANITNGQDSGLTSDDDVITYWLSNNGQTLQGRTNSTNGTDGQLVFTVQINQAAGTYTVTMTGTIDNGAGVTFDDLTSASSGNTDYRGVGEDDPLTTVDLLLSASTNGVDDSVNTSAVGIGVGAQSIGTGSAVRIDFVSNLETGAATPTGFSYDGHVDTNSFIQLVPQVQGNQAQVVSFKVWALDTTLTDAGEPDRNTGNGFSDSTTVFITEVTVIDYLTAGETTLDISGLAVDATVAVAYGISVTRNADGSVTFSGVQEGDQYGISTGANDFNAITILNTSGTFDLGIFSIGQVDSGDPINLSYDLSITDADGDSIVMDDAIAITLEPVGTTSLSTMAFSQEAVEDSSFTTLVANDNQSQQLAKTTANSNTTVFAAALAAAGLAGTPAAAFDGFAADHGDFAFRNAVVSIDAVGASGGYDGIDSFQLGDGMGFDDAFSFGDMASGSGFQAMAGNPASIGQLAGFEGIGSAFHALPGGSDAFASPMAMPTIGADIAMPSADMLMAANLMGGQQSTGSVEKIVADALHGGGGAPDIGAILDAIPGHGGGIPAFDALASLDQAGVPGWDMAHGGAFTFGNAGIITAEALVLHHDAVQPVANG